MAVGGRIAALLCDPQVPVYRTGIVQKLLNGGIFLHLFGVLGGDGEIILQHFPKLEIDNIGNRILEAKPGQQQSGTAGDADHRHQEPLFVPEQIPGGDFVDKGKPGP